MKIMITGGAGFIGSNFVHHISKNDDYEVVVLDKLTYAGNMDNLKEVRDGIEFVEGDIKDEEVVSRVMKDCDMVVNFAAETHVDVSIEDPGIFIESNVKGTYNLLEHVRKYDVERYLQISTDEVYGSIDEGSFTEESNLDPSSPYSASKAGGDLLVSAYWKTYDTPVITTRSSNNFGPRQYPEKLIPLFIMNAMQDKPLPVYGDGKNVRDWIYVMDNCKGIEVALLKGKLGEVYNIGGGNEKNNLEITNLILDILGKPESLVTFVEDRLGHDRRYSLDSSKIMKLGWRPEFSFEKAMLETVEWYKTNFLEV
ncbi:dTDP-glucose 4,6-dehydratase [Methanobacterium petrolearium]|uniref:dTDP-glucose 4,6-dehydratase n=1 Tax=Methanobacterium petrolearium TaxID=710190 RepID=UPI001AEB367D|nr:dTDP-glucose 4,6-dehydratase [Methanobacterium petrolearium]MBP1946441.1 dTDP-glucose 4,6-dehydratase [Methanobacterium petrolearium]BDZ70531.1 dTDP-glucose 4,6-dehydratase [Methanobacterium petrolearium]